MTADSSPRAAVETKPNPDPTLATTAGIERAIKAERDFTLGQISRIEQRMDDRDEATKVLHETVTRVPTDMQLAIGHLHDLMNEKFDSVNTRFALNDDRQKSESVANDTKVTAAFNAQKESAAKQDEANQKSIDKSEKATNESISKLGAAAEAANRALGDKLDDLKERLVRLEDRTTKIEATKAGGQETRTEDRASSANTRAIIAFGLSVILAAIIVIGVIVAAKIGTIAP